MGQFRSPMCEWNGRFRDDVRDFVRGEPGMVSKLATAVSGSQDRFGSDGTRLPVNFVTVHDGFSLMDLVSYDSKHNEDNGEENRDGESHNRSWNCGYEGSDLTNAPISDEEKRTIDALRRKQIKNFLTLLLVSRGVPLILYGDEMGRTNGGNNNPYCQLELNQLDWELVNKNADLMRFTRMMIAFRKAHYLGGRGHQPVFRNIVWHGAKPYQANWEGWSRLLVWQLDQFQPEGQDADQAVYIATNSHWEPAQIELPEGNWHRIVDTSLASGQDIVADDDAQQVGPSLTLEPRSTVVLLRK
jgi:glycogen operon protein